MTTFKHLCFVLVLGAASLGAASAQETPAGYKSLDTLDQPASATTAPVSAIEYTVTRGDSLRATLERWSKQAGWQEVSWKLPEDTDFTLGASHTFKGDFVQVTRALTRALGVEAELRVRLNQGNKLVVVEPLK